MLKKETAEIKMGNIDDIESRATSITMFEEPKFSAIRSRDMQDDGVFLYVCLDLA